MLDGLRPRIPGRRRAIGLQGRGGFRGGAGGARAMDTMTAGSVRMASETGGE